MQLDTPKFLKVFGISIPDNHNGVNDSVIHCRCPLHQDPDGSMLAVKKANGETRFECTNPRCRFRGDAVALVSLSRNLPLVKVLELFRPGGELSTTLREPLRAVEAEAYLDDAGAQAVIKAYMLFCERELHRSPERANIRPGLSSASRILPTGVGLFVNSGVPKCLSEFCKPRYRGTPLLLYPYTYDGDITCLEVRDASSPSFRQIVPVTRHDLGVYNEDAADCMFEGKKRVFVTADPLAVVRFRLAYAQQHSDVFPVTAVAGLPLPDRFAGISSLVLLSLDDFPFSLDTVLSYVSTDQVITSQQHGLQVKVVNLKKKSAECTCEVVENLLSGSSGKSAAEWAVRLMLDLAAKGRTKEISDALVKAKLPEIISSAMSRYVSTCAEDRGACRIVQELLEKPITLSTSDIILANGRSVRRGPASLMAMLPRGLAETIANVGMAVESKIVSYSGEEVLACSISTEDKEIPHIKVNLPEKTWDSAQKLQKLVSKAFISRGFSPYIALYEVKGYKWRDILAKLSEHCPVSKEVSELGPDDVSDIQLPAFAVRSTGEIVRQSRVFTLPEHTLRVYGGLSFGERPEDPLSVWKSCLEKCDNLYVAAFTLGVMHVLYQMTFGLYRAPTTKKHANRHFFFVETEPGIWGATFKQVADLFSGSDFTPTLSYAKPDETLTGFRQLGCLPLIAHVPTMGVKLAEALDGSTVDLLGVVDSSTAVMTNGKVSAVYVTPSQDVPADRGIIDGNDLNRLREAFPWLISHFVQNVKIDGAYRSSSTPCITAYNEVCKLLGVKRRPVEEIAKAWFPGTGMNGVDMFFDLLHRSVVESKPKLCIVREEPQEGKSFTRRGQHAFVLKNHVVISRMVVDVINKAEKGLCEFSPEQLSQELEERGFLVPLPDRLKPSFDMTRSWCISRETWETRVVRPPINLLAPVSSETIRLQPVIRNF